MKKNILLTGGAGYIGSHVTNLLIKKGFYTNKSTNSKIQDRSGITKGFHDAAMILKSRVIAFQQVVFLPKFPFDPFDWGCWEVKIGV